MSAADCAMEQDALDVITLAALEIAAEWEAAVSAEPGALPPHFGRFADCLGERLDMIANELVALRVEAAIAKYEQSAITAAGAALRSSLVGPSANRNAEAEYSGEQKGRSS